MKIQLKSILLLLGVTFFILAGFKNADQRGGKVILSKDQSRRVSIELILTGKDADGSFIGTFTAHGGIEASGTIEMDANFFGNFAHCSQTFTTRNGTFTALSNCEFVTNTGTWNIVGGTGRYSNLQGNGKLIMTGGGFVESWSGTVRGNRGHQNRHDDDDDD